MKLATVLATVFLAAQATVAQGVEYKEWTVTQMNDAMNAGTLTSVKLTQYYLDRIAKYNPALRAVIETDPQALAWADQADKDRVICNRAKTCNPLLGIPVLLKDNIATRDLMQTTAGSWALFGSISKSDAHVVDRLRKAGAVLLGKANLSEFANLRDALVIPSGWSGRGGQTINPYNATAFVCGSSSGSAVAVTANLAAVTLGTETDGSIICPSAFNGAVGFKPTLGLVSRSGVIPISHTQDSVGPIVRTVADAAYLLDAIAGTDSADNSTVNADKYKPKTSYASYLSTSFSGGMFTGLRIGYDPFVDQDQVLNKATSWAKGILGTFGANATLVPLPFPKVEFDQGETELLILFTEFKAGLNSYLANLQYSPVRSLSALMQATKADKRENIYPFANWEASQATKGLNDPAYLDAVKRQAQNVKAIDKLFADNKLDIYIGNPLELSHYAALGGYPVMTVPVRTPFGSTENDSTPLAVGFLGLPYSEPSILKFASLVEIVNSFFGGRLAPSGF
ncbi:amidase signature domain-containing protein [Obelidium mucronatum]|nr:amidase signature domain-containing protein [Obelidium mucronatum]